MMHVTLANEPDDFDTLVRQPGLNAIAELVGEQGDPLKKVANHRDELKGEHYPPYWRNATSQLLQVYNRICAYACFYIEPTTGAATVDHFAPKSQSWDKAYEWSNYRLACSLMNTRKNKFDDVIDPFDVTEGLFALDLVTLKAIPGPKADAKTEDVKATIKRLRLDRAEYSEQLGEYYHNYWEGHITFAYLERRAPFLAYELKRQGRQRHGDV